MTPEGNLKIYSTCFLLILILFYFIIFLPYPYNSPFLYIVLLLVMVKSINLGVNSSLTGNYTCSAKNLFGEDEIVYTVLSMETPKPPQCTIQYSTTDSIRLSWDTPYDGGTAIEVYIKFISIAFI